MIELYFTGWKQPLDGIKEAAQYLWASIIEYPSGTKQGVYWYVSMTRMPGEEPEQVQYLGKIQADEIMQRVERLHVFNSPFKRRHKRRLIKSITWLRWQDLMINTQELFQRKYLVRDRL